MYTRTTIGAGHKRRNCTNSLISTARLATKHRAAEPSSKTTFLLHVSQPLSIPFMSSRNAAVVWDMAVFAGKRPLLFPFPLSRNATVEYLCF